MLFENNEALFEDGEVLYENSRGILPRLSGK
jgi:hypothetical protein